MGEVAREVSGPWQEIVLSLPALRVPDPERWVHDDYIVIAADSRGTGASPGMLDPMSPREIEDYATLITWASRQSWSTGKVGLLGTSYMAINQWLAAARQPTDLPPSFRGKAHSIITAR